MRPDLDRMAPADLPGDLRALVRFARLLDEEFAIPGIRRRFGLDALVGLVPGVGDVVGAVLSVWIVIVALRHRVPGGRIWGMLGRIAADELIGVVPVLGDLFDLLFKENVANVEGVLRYRDPSRPPRRWGQMALAAIALSAVVLGLTVLTLLAAALVLSRILRPLA